MMSESSFIDNLKKNWDLYLILSYSTIAALLLTPGFLYFDSFDHIRMIEEGVDSTWQSPIPAIIWYPFYQGFYFTGIILLHFLTINLGLFYSTRFFIKNKLFNFTLCVSLMSTPLLFSFSVMSLRESLLLGLTLCFLALAFRIRKYPHLIILLIFAIPASIIRYELLPVFIIIWFFLYFLKIKNKSMTKLAGLVFLTITSLGVPKLMQISFDKYKSYPAAQIFQLDLIQMKNLNPQIQINHENIILEKVNPNIFAKQPGDIIPYMQGGYPSVDMYFQGDSFSRLRDTWLSVIKEHPFIYLENRWITSKRLMRLPGQNSCMDFVVFEEPVSPYGYRWSNEPWFNRALEFMKKHSNSGYYQPYIIMMASIVCLLLALSLGGRDFFIRRKELLVPFVFSWLGFIVSFIVTPTCHMRVIILQMVLLLFFSVVLLACMIEDLSTKKGLAEKCQALLKKVALKYLK